MSLLEVGQYAGAITAVLVLLGIVIKYAILVPIKAYIDHATYPLNPLANGGSSLADANKTLKRIEVKLDEVDDRLLAVENLVTKPATRASKSKI